MMTGTKQQTMTKADVIRRTACLKTTWSDAVKQNTKGFCLSKEGRQVSKW